MENMDTHESYVSPKVAKLLKEAGFDWKCPCHWGDGSKGDAAFIMPKKPVFYSNVVFGNIAIEDEDWNHLERLNDNTYQVYSAPSLDVAQRWLREVRGRFIYVEPLSKDNYRISYICRELNGFTTKEFSTYEKAQEAGIKKALEIILEKGK